MKQEITTKQWKEISVELRYKFWGRKFEGVLSSDLGEPRPSIGDLIEFLGDKWQFIVCYHSSFGDIALRPDNLCDALWESVSYKLSTA